MSVPVEELEKLVQEAKSRQRKASEVIWAQVDKLSANPGPVGTIEAARAIADLAERAARLANDGL